jgi:ABC-type nitrate/sulfonate/bicarbonate transport system substrate-binding protein
MRRRECLGSLAFGAAGILGGCSANGHRENSLLRVATVPGIYAAPLHLANELGYFTHAGLTLEIQPMSSDAETVPPLATGQIHAALASVTPAFVNTVAKGRHLRIVAGRQIASPTCGSVGTLYGNRNAFPDGLSDLRRLKGKRIAVTSATTFTGFCLDTFLAVAGLNAADIDEVSLRQQESIAALVAGKLDAIVVSQFDYALEALSPVVIKGIGLAAIFPNFQASYMMFGPSLLEAAPQIGTSFLAAYLRGTDDFMAGKTPRFLDEYARNSRLDSGKLRWGCHDWFARDGKIDFSSVRRSVDWMVARKFCQNRFEAEQLVDTRFVDAVEAAKQASAVK